MGSIAAGKTDSGDYSKQEEMDANNFHNSEESMKHKWSKE
jgi:hypothetical protein